MDDAEIIQRTQNWLRALVVGQGLCPFAREPMDGGRLRIVVSQATDPEALAADLITELDLLDESPAEQVETTLLVHPNCLEDFLAYNDFLDVVEAIVAEGGLEGVVQVASFHPDYRFADTEPDAPENYTNRSPFPMLHLIREASVTKAVEGHPDVGSIPQRNIELLRTLTHEQLERWRRGDE